MRRILSLESQTDLTAALPEISLEEEQILLNEAANDQAEVDSELGEIDRVIEVSDALEDLAVIADGIEEAKPSDIALVQAVGDVAVAGTDVQPEDVVPSLESYVGKRIATEGIRETAATMWRNVQAFLKRIWEKITSFFYRVFGTIPNMRKRIAALEKKVDECVGKTAAEPKVTIVTGLVSLTAEGKQVKNESELAKELKYLDSQCKNVFNNWMGHIAAAGEKIAGAIADFDAEKAEESASKLLAIAEKNDFSAAGFKKCTRIPNFDCSISDGLLGGVSLLRKEFDGGDGSTLGKLDRIRRSGLDLVQTSEKAANLPAQLEFATMTPSAAEAILKDCSSILDTLEEYQRGKRSKEVAATQKKIESASAKATANVEKLGDTEGGKAAIPYYRKTLDFNAAYANWAHQPASGMIRNTLQVINAVMLVVQKSVAQYK